MTPEERKKALERLSKSRRSRAIAAMEKNTPENVAKELFNVQEKVKSITEDNESFQEADKKATERKKELMKRNYLNSLRQRQKWKV